MYDMPAQIVFGLFFVAAGAFLITGALRRWGWLIDPPSYLWFCYSQSLLKAVFGSEGCRLITLNLGAVFICAGIFLSVRGAL